MDTAFYIAGAIAILTTVRVITHNNAVHALLYFIVSLLSVAVVFYVIGAPLVAALEVIVYAGAIMVLFLFVVMMLNLGRAQAQQERDWMRPRVWIGPGLTSATLLVLLAWVVMSQAHSLPSESAYPPPQEVGRALFGPYLIAVQLAALLLLAGLVGASHLRRHTRRTQRGADETIEPVDGKGADTP